MKLNYKQFESKAEGVLEEVDKICQGFGRDSSTVNVLAVTKAQSPEAVDFAARFGFKAIGENRVQEAARKKPSAQERIRWELIGHLQSNKAKLAVSLFDRIQSVDRIKLVRALDRYAGETGKTLPVLLQVNTGEDPNKFGVSCREAHGLMEAALQCRNILVEGFMTIAPLDEDRSVALAAFERLRILRDEFRASYDIPLKELSMGMSGDMAEAIRAGSTCLRLGTALFGMRD